MGSLIAFPKRAATKVKVAENVARGTVVIFTGVRIERHHGAPMPIRTRPRSARTTKRSG